MKIILFQMIIPVFENKINVSIFDFFLSQGFFQFDKYTQHACYMQNKLSIKQ